MKRGAQLSLVQRRPAERLPTTVWTCTWPSAATSARSSSRASRAIRARSAIASCMRRSAASPMRCKRARRRAAAIASSSICRWFPRPSSRCRPARASAPSTRWCSAASRRCRCASASRMPGATLVITADGGWRGGQIVPLKGAVDKALRRAARRVGNVVVLRRTGAAGDHAGPARPLVARTHRQCSRRSASRSGSMPSIRCTCCTPRVRPASPRAFSTRAPAIC